MTNRVVSSGPEASTLKASRTIADSSMSPTERRAAMALASVFGLRMLGLFLVLPVLAIYGQAYPDYTPALVGLAIGAYGLTQALLQIPMGTLSDRIGRRPVIIGGLLVFALGSLVAAYADTLMGVVIGRAMQGMGAIAAAVLALAADVSRDQQRPKVMATIGMCIGLAFALALVLGPILAASIGLQGLFLATAIAAIIAIPVLLFGVPKVVTKSARREAVPVVSELGALLKQTQLVRLNLGVFVLHAVLTAWFLVLPQQLLSAGLTTEQHAWIYLPALVGSIVCMVPLLILAAKRDAHVSLFRFGIGLLVVAVVLAMLASDRWWVLLLTLLVFFAGFNYLEASLPSLLTRMAPAGSKGSASGIYATFQFGGAFIGGVLGGIAYATFGTLGVGILCVTLLVCWGLITIGMTVRSRHKNLAFALRIGEAHATTLVAKLTALPGIEEARVVLAEQMTYLKVNQDEYNEQAVKDVLASYQGSV